MKALFFAIAMVIAASAGLAGPAAAAWGPPGFDVQAQGGGRGRGQERAQPGRDYRPERRPERDERRDRLNDDERRALHRDLDKANRELYQGRNQR